MKKIFMLFMIMAFTTMIYAQSDADKMEIGVGGTFAKPKIIPKATKLGIAQITVNFKLNTTARATSREKGTGAMAGAKVTAVMETTDGELTSADFQEITDYFYTYFQQKLKDNGIETVAWDKIKATDFYQNGTEKSKEKTGNSNNMWVTSTANNGNVIYGGGIAFTFGKAKKATNFAEEIGAPAAYFNLTVDFADVNVGVKITTENAGVYALTRTRSFKYDASVKAEVQVIHTGQTGFSLFWNEKNQAETLYLKNDLEGVTGYQDAINQDPSRMKNNPFRFAKEMVPVVIETTREKYKAAAKKALEKYADAFVAKTKDSGK